MDTKKSCMSLRTVLYLDNDDAIVYEGHAGFLVSAVQIQGYIQYLKFTLSFLDPCGNINT